MGGGQGAVVQVPGGHGGSLGDREGRVGADEGRAAGRQLGGALGLAVIATVVSDATARSAAAGHAQPDALTAGFHAGFAVSAGLLVAGVLAAVTLLREEGRGERVNLLELQAGS